MRTTLTLEKDVAAALENLQKKRDATFKDVVNEALRRGIKAMSAPGKPQPFQTKVHDPKGLVDPSKSIKDILRDMDEEYDTKKLGLRVSD
jgi:hypothetical protein